MWQSMYAFWLPWFSGPGGAAVFWSTSGSEILRWRGGIVGEEKRLFFFFLTAGGGEMASDSLELSWIFIDLNGLIVLVLLLLTEGTLTSQLIVPKKKKSLTAHIKTVINTCRGKVARAVECPPCEAQTDKLSEGNQDNDFHLLNKQILIICLTD